MSDYFIPRDFSLRSQDLIPPYPDPEPGAEADEAPDVEAALADLRRYLTPP